VGGARGGGKQRFAVNDVFTLPCPSLKGGETVINGFDPLPIFFCHKDTKAQRYTKKISK